MERKVYSIRDAKAGVFNLPFIKLTHGEAERDFTSLCNDTKSTPNQFPEDFDLYYVGIYDDVTGVITSLDTPQHMMKAVAAIRR